MYVHVVICVILRENLLESGEGFESRPVSEKLSRHPTSSSFGSDDESSNEDQVRVYCLDVFSVAL